ncbi:MAG: hypothetical protein HGA93_04865 [Methanothrix sp.]|nr:hypothetical protein [Methanothrix sp.]
MENQLIKGKVANIVNERELAINVGSSNGVKVGMKFKVLTDEPTQVIDPDSKEVLGYIDREKVRVQVIEVAERFAVCKTYRMLKTPGGIDLSLGSLILQPSHKQETLRADQKSFLPPLSEEESYVKRGDRVIQIMGDGEK